MTMQPSEDRVFDPKAAKRGPTELCVVCGKDTGVLIGTPIENRIYYIQGAGQACRDCGESNRCDPCPGNG